MLIDTILTTLSIDEGSFGGDHTSHMRLNHLTQPSNLTATVTAHTMLCDLPVEVFQQILGHFVLVSGIARSVRLRLVSKLFAREVKHAICSTKLLETRRWRFDRVDAQFFTDYLVFRFMVNPNGKDTLTLAIQGAIDATVKLEGHEHNRHNYTRTLWAAVVDNMSSLQIFGYLNSDALERLQISSPGTYEVSNSLLSAAAILGKSDLLLTATKSELSISNQYLGFPLVGAAKSGHRDLVATLTTRIGGDGDRLDVRDAMKAAAREGDIGTVELIEQKISSKPISNETLEAVIVAAASGGHGHIIDHLMEGCTDETITDCFKLPISGSRDLRCRILLVAARNGHLALVRKCLKDGVEQSNCLEPVLESAVLLGRTAVVKEVAAVTKTVAPFFEKVVLDAVCIASRCGYVEILQVFLDCGLRLEVYDDRSHAHPLVWAAKCGQAQVVNFLLNPALNLRSARGFDKIVHRALRLACGKGYISVIKAMKEAGLAVNELDRDPSDRLAMIIAMIAGRTSVVELLLEYGAEKIDPLSTRCKEDFESGRFPLEEVKANEDADRYGYPYPGSNWG